MVVLVTLDAAYSWVGHDCWAGVWTGTRSKIATATRRKRVYGTDGSVVGREEGKKMSILGSVQRKNKINGFVREYGEELEKDGCLAVASHAPSKPKVQL